MFYFIFWSKSARYTLESFKRQKNTQLLKSDNIALFHLKVQDKLSKIECEFSDSFRCLQWRCEKYQENQMSKLDASQQKENIDIYYFCKNWISLNQFLIEWMLPAIRLVLINWNFFKLDFRPDAIDLLLCSHRKTDKGVLDSLKPRFCLNSKWELTFFSFFKILHFADTLSLTTRMEMYMKKTMLSSSNMRVAEYHRTIIIVNSTGKVDFSPIYRRMINISFSNATMERVTWNRITRISQSFKRDKILHNDKIYFVWNSSNVYLNLRFWKS